MTWMRAALLSIVLAVAACGPPSSAELLERVEGIETRQALVQELGRPDKVTKLGPIENWTYETSDGEVTFLITGETIQLTAGGTADDK